jgi:Biotin carboxyl carrier protein
MTDSTAELEQVRRAADELVPQLTERLAAHGLGEIEVRSGDLRVRVSAAPATGAPVAAAPVGVSAASAASGPVAAPPAPSPGSHGVLSPAVGYFVFGEGFGPGLRVEKGDPLGFVEVLGVHHDVRAPRRGTVRNLVTETGEAVEYGQTLIELEASEA